MTSDIEQQIADMKAWLVEVTMYGEEYTSHAISIIEALQAQLKRLTDAIEFVDEGELPREGDLVVYDDDRLDYVGLVREEGDVVFVDLLNDGTTILSSHVNKIIQRNTKPTLPKSILTGEIKP